VLTAEQIAERNRLSLPNPKPKQKGLSTDQKYKPTERASAKQGDRRLAAQQPSIKKDGIFFNLLKGQLDCTIN